MLSKKEKKKWIIILCAVLFCWTGFFIIRDLHYILLENKIWDCFEEYDYETAQKYIDTFMDAPESIQDRYDVEELYSYNYSLKDYCQDSYALDVQDLFFPNLSSKRREIRNELSEKIQVLNEEKIEEYTIREEENRKKRETERRLEELQEYSDDIPFYYVPEDRDPGNGCEPYDPYNSQDYSTEEDFYEDYEDEFYDFEDAEDYYYDNE